MKLSLIVFASGKPEGKVIPILLPQFVIGRGPECNLRPASPMISKRHCALLVRGGKVYLRDFDSTNGTFVNDKPVKGEVELCHEDVLKVGPLSFKVHIEATIPTTKPGGPPAKKKAMSLDEDSIADLLLSLDDETVVSGSAAADLGEDGTVSDMPA